MGRSQSKPVPPFPEFDRPWRDMPWGQSINIERKLRDLKLKSEIRFVRILMVGEVGAGKSSFINSVNTAFQKRITCTALADGVGGTSFTKEYTTHYIDGEDGSPLPFVFNDIMGLEASDSGASLQDIIKGMKGTLQEGYNFASSGSMEEKDDRSKPSLEDQCYCLVNIIAADKISLMNDLVIKKLRKIREEASHLKIPQVIIMTRPDFACPLVKKNIYKIYTSKKIKEKMEECSIHLGIPMSHIFPVKNYHEEIDPHDDIDLLILKALDQIVNIAADAAKKETRKRLEPTSSDPRSCVTQTHPKNELAKVFGHRGLEPVPRDEPQTEFDRPWREMHWGISIEQKLRDFKLKSEIRFVRILIVGEVGAGKSSFINSVNTAFQKRITCKALADGVGGTSFTKEYTTHYIDGEDGSPLPFAFNDIMGLEGSDEGASSQDIIKAMNGILKEGYNFEDAYAGSMEHMGYRSNPSLEDQTSCLVNIIAADKVSMMNDLVIQKLKKIREAASKKHIPQVIIMTRPDLVCPLVTNDIQKIYTSKKIKQKMLECSNRLGVPMSHIFPVKNYHEEIDPHEDIDLLILKALDQIVNIAADAAKTASGPPSHK